MRITYAGERFHAIVGYNRIRIRNELIERALIPCEIGSLHRIGIGKALDATGPASQNAKKRGPKPVVVRLA